MRPPTEVTEATRSGLTRATSRTVGPPWLWPIRLTLPEMAAISSACWSRTSPGDSAVQCGSLGDINLSPFGPKVPGYAKPVIDAYGGVETEHSAHQYDRVSGFRVIGRRAVPPPGRGRSLVTGVTNGGYACVGRKITRWNPTPTSD